MGRPAVLRLDIISDLQGKGFSETDRALQQMGRGAQIAATAIGGALVAGGLQAVNAASALGETMNAVEKTFGPASATITAFGEGAAESVGLSQRAFQELAVNTGSLLTNFGYSQQEAADATTELATRAADMASVFNTDVDTALGAINAGLRGETEPLRAFGVNLNDAALKGKALELGLYEGAGALDANAKAAAAQALIMEQTAKTSGDFADTSDSLANRQRTLQASVEDAAAQLGQSLLPAAESVVGVLQEMVEWARQNEDKVKQLTQVAAGFVAVVLGATAAVKAYNAVMVIIKATQAAWTAITKAMTIAQKALNLAMRLNPIGLIVTAIGLLIAGLVTAYNKSETFRNIVDRIASTIRNVAVGAFEAVSSAISTFVGWLQSAWEWVGNVISKIGELVSNSPLGAVADLIGGLFSAEDSLGTALQGAQVSASMYGGAAGPQARAGALVSRLSASDYRRGAAGGVVVNVNGALDPDAVARQIRRILTTHDRRTGAAWAGAV